MKPENIGFDIRGDVKVFDFGLAKSLLPHLKADDGLYQLTGPTGSFPYMAPEVAKRENYDEKCDVFSFGIMFWQMMSLKRPFPLLTTNRLCYEKISVGGARPAMPRFNKWSPRIKEVMTSSWKASPKDRPSMAVIRFLLMEELEKKKATINGEFHSKYLSEKSRQSMHLSLVKRSEHGGRRSQHGDISVW
jgi:serine/threonine protein kinase